MKKRSNIFWIVARIVKHTHEQSPTRFLNLHGNRNSKEYKLLFNYSETKGKENCCSVMYFPCAQQLLAQCSVSASICTCDCAPIWLKPVCLSFPEKLRVIYFCSCKKTSGYTLMYMLFSSKTAVLHQAPACSIQEKEQGTELYIQLNTWVSLSLNTDDHLKWCRPKLWRMSLACQGKWWDVSEIVEVLTLVRTLQYTCLQWSRCNSNCDYPGWPQPKVEQGHHNFPFSMDPVCATKSHMSLCNIVQGWMSFCARIQSTAVQKL